MSAASLHQQHRRASSTPVRALVRMVGRRVQQAWCGSPELPAHLRMEQRFIAVRYLGILCLAPTLPLLSLSAPRLAAAYGLLLVAALYNVAVQLLLRRGSPWLNKGYVTSIGDGLLNIAMVMLGGGFASSFYLILFTTTIGAAMRYGYGPSLLVVGVYVTLDALDVLFIGPHTPGVRGDFFFRSGFLGITTVLAGYLREQARAAEAALARQLERARALNDSTRTLSASLNLDTVVPTVVIEARRLVNAEDAGLVLGAELGARASYDVSGLELSFAQRKARQRMLEQLSRIDGADDELHEVRHGYTDDGRRYMVVPLQARSGLLGCMVVVRPYLAHAYEQADEDILVSFIDRATLAIENASLYKTIGDRSRDLHRAYADLAAAHQELLGVDEMKTNFIANVSHELRTPLTSIRSFSEILLSFAVDDVTQREFLGIINAESERLTRLINDVLDITKIEAGQVDWNVKDVDLTELLRTSARTFVSLAEEHDLHFELAPPSLPVKVHADPDRVLQVLSNLLGNAMKFTSKGSIVMGATIIDGMARIYVSDTGVGVAPEDHERIFEKFHQVGDTMTEKPTGTGLGLCICRDIVNHHGGTIWVESSPGNGSTFTFTLPLAAGEAQGRAEAHANG